MLVLVNARLAYMLQSMIMSVLSAAV